MIEKIKNKIQIKLLGELYQKISKLEDRIKDCETIIDYLLVYQIRGMENDGK